jgi:hypothetical protein
MVYRPLIQLKVTTKSTMGLKRATTPTAAGAPTEKDLGLPVYPNAAYVKQASVVNEQMMSCSWTVKAAPPEVAAFYEKATSLKSRDMGNNTFMIQVMPGEGNPAMIMIMIMPNPGGAYGPGATLLQINKQVVR